jgi:hypothetical protein
MMKPKLPLLIVFLTVLLSACAPRAEQMPTALLPAGKAYANGQEIYFVHTEASDEALAATLTKMMDSPVLYVPALADIPAHALANVYVFENGLAGKGPLGFQADVFDAPPDAPDYSPLRRVNVVAWVDPAQARLLTSAAAVLAAQLAGEVTVAQPGAVVNMPFVVWEGGKR